MKNKKLISGIIVVALVIMGLVTFDYVFNGKHRNIAQEDAEVSMSAQDFFEHFKNNETLATTTYLDKVIELKGKITTIEDGDIVLSNGVQASLITQTDTKLKEGDTVTLKGRCVGYDELLELVKIDQSTIIKK